MLAILVVVILEVEEMAAILGVEEVVSILVVEGLASILEVEEVVEILEVEELAAQFWRRRRLLKTNIDARNTRVGGSLHFY